MIVNNPNLEIMAQIQSCYWWHSIDLGNGIVTPGQKSIELMQEEFSKSACGEDRRSGYSVDLTCGGARPAALSSAMI